MSQTITTSPVLCAPIMFVPHGERVIFYPGDRQRSHLPFEYHDVNLYNARADDTLGLDRSGFTLAKWQPDPFDPYDDADVQARYYPQAEIFAKNLVGAAEAIAFAHVVRSAAAGAAEGRQPSFSAHVDFQEETVRQFMVELLGEAESAKRRCRRVMAVNIWRPLKPVETTPLALCDASTVQASDLTTSEIRGALMSPDRPPIYGYSLHYNPDHRWYYTPEMRPDEVYAFRVFDSDPAALQWTGHCAFEDPSAAADAAPRESIELRTLLIMP